jgi:hypothetical protein
MLSLAMGLHSLQSFSTLIAVGVLDNVPVIDAAVCCQTNPMPASAALGSHMGVCYTCHMTWNEMWSPHTNLGP